MRKILVTGGTTFVSRFAANYFVQKGEQVYVLNRNHSPQIPGVTLIEGDRNELGDKLKEYHFDAVLDITAYTKSDVEHLVEALPEIKQYIFISSSAVYSETLKRPFKETQECGVNTIWGDYSANKLAAEKYLQKEVPQAYIIRPPYLYGPMQNLYREPFVFDCAGEDRLFYVPKDGSMSLHFFHVEDLCRFMGILLDKQPKEHIFNVGNSEIVDVNEWVRLCYQAAGKEAIIKYVGEEHPQRSYFCFHDYDYTLDISRQKTLMEDTKPLTEGLAESYKWYMSHLQQMQKKDYISYIKSYIEKEIETCQ